MYTESPLKWPSLRLKKKSLKGLRGYRLKGILSIRQDQEQQYLLFESETFFSIIQMCGHGKIVM